MEEAGREYKPVSQLAVAALVAGTLSALALVSPLCWVLPLVAIGLAVAALGDVQRPAAAKAGGLAATAGLALAIGFGSQALADAAVARWLVQRRAAATARQWVEAVRSGRLADALSICGPRVLARLGSPQADANGLPTPERAFASTAVVRAVTDCGPRRPPVGSASRAPGEMEWVVAVPLATCGRGTDTLHLTVEPEMVPRQGGAVERWLVTGYAIER